MDSFYRYIFFFFLRWKNKFRPPNWEEGKKPQVDTHKMQTTLPIPIFAHGDWLLAGNKHFQESHIQNLRAENLWISTVSEVIIAWGYYSRQRILLFSHLLQHPIFSFMVDPQLTNPHILFFFSWLTIVM